MATPQNTGYAGTPKHPKEIMALQSAVFNDDETGTPPADGTDQTSHEEKSSKGHDYEKRYRDLQSYHDRTVNDLKKELSDLKKQVEAKGKPSIQLPKTIEELEAKKKDYPDLYSLIESVAILKAKQVSEEINEKITTLEEREAQLAKKTAKQILLEAHPDAFSIKDSAEFEEWFLKQRKGIQNLFNSDDPEDVIAGFDAYKSALSVKKNPDKSGNLDASMTVKTNAKGAVPEGGSPSYSESQIERETRRNPNWFEKHEAAINEAIAEGRFVYDLSGS